MNTHHPAHIDDLTPLPAPIQQVIPGYQYPFSLAPERFPDVFYRLHRTENWMDIHSSLPSKPYNPSEHGWSAKDTQTLLPSSPKEILSLVRNHFDEKSSYASTPSNSIFVPGVWRAGKCSKVSLWDNQEDAREEGRRIGGVEIFEVGGEVLREGGSVVFCLEELLGRSSALCWVTRGRYGKVGSWRKGKGEGKGVKKRKGRWWGRGGRREGEGLRGKAYLVVGVIPGTHNLPQPTPVISTTDINNIDHIFHIQNGEEYVMKEGTARTSLPSTLSTHRRETPGSFGEFDFNFGLQREQEHIHETPLSQIPSPYPPARTKCSDSHITTNDSGVFSWTLDNPDVNNIQEFEIKRDIRRRAQGMKRNSAFMRMEKISEDIGDRGVVAGDEVGEVEEYVRGEVEEYVRGEEEEGEGKEEEVENENEELRSSKGWSWGENEKENHSHSKRRITSTAKITRKGTFGEGFNEKSTVFRDEKRTSLQSQSFSSRDLAQRSSDGRGRVERSRYIDMGTSTSGRISYGEDGSEDGMSVGEEISEVVGGGAGVAKGRAGVDEVLRMNDGWGGDGSDHVGMGVRGKKKIGREENNFEYGRSMAREREEVLSFGSRVSSFVGAVDDDQSIEEEEDPQHEDTNLDIEIPDSRSDTNSRIPTNYLKSRRPIPRKTISRDEYY
ncbi:hypothetical protein EAE96_009217 [Botrytis aclada]|nr:hypothetical protein EAE96_009217 [Botrytis aclada]